MRRIPTESEATTGEEPSGFGDSVEGEEQDRLISTAEELEEEADDLEEQATVELEEEYEPPEELEEHTGRCLLFLVSVVLEELLEDRNRFLFFLVLWVFDEREED